MAGRATHAMVGHKNTAHWHSGELLCLVSSLGAELSSRERLNGLSRYRTAVAGWAEGGRREIFPFKNKGGKKKSNFLAAGLRGATTPAAGEQYPSSASISCSQLHKELHENAELT